MPTPEELAAQKAAEEAKKADEEAKKGEIDPKIAELMKDPDAVANLLAAKRAANDEAKKLRLKMEALDAAEKAKEEKALQEQGKFKELAEKAKGEAEAIKANFKAQRIALELRLEAVVAGAVDPDDVVALSDRAQITITDDFASVTGAKEAVEVLKQKKPHLFGKPADGGTPAPGARQPSPRGGFLPNTGTSAHEDLSAGFQKSKR